MVGGLFRLKPLSTDKDCWRSRDTGFMGIKLRFTFGTYSQQK